MTITPEEVQLGWAVPPGRMLQRELDARDITQAQLAARAGLSAKHVNLVVKGHVPLSADMAVILEQVLGTSAEVWLRIEAGYRAQEARRDRRESLLTFTSWTQKFPRDVLEAKGVLAEGDPTEARITKLLGFFGVASPDAFEKTWLAPQAAYKRSQIHTIDPYLTALWLRLAETQASDLIDTAAVFDASRLRRVGHDLPRLTRKPIDEGFQAAQAALLTAGVALVFVPEIRNTRISGVSRWIGSHPMIAVTSRYKFFDSFWFTLLHEVGHLLLHPKRGTYIDYTGKATDDADLLESAASDYAQATIVPREHLARVVKAETVDELVAIADELQVSPGVLAGQRAYLTDDWGGPLASLRERGDLEEVLGAIGRS